MVIGVSHQIIILKKTLRCRNKTSFKRISSTLHFTVVGSVNVFTMCADEPKTCLLDLI